MQRRRSSLRMPWPWMGARREEYHTGWKMERALSKAGPAAKEERSAEEVRPAMEAAPRSKEEIAGMGHRESWTL